MMRIWKCSLHLFDTQFVDVPDGAEPVHLELQGEMVCLWVKVNIHAPKIQMEVHKIGTGETIPERCTYLGTVVMPNKTVWHYFWRIP